MSSHITSVTLTTEQDDDHGRTAWRLDWTENDGRRDTTWTMTHFSEAAARRHATGLCAKRPPGTTRRRHLHRPALTTFPVSDALT